LEIIKSSDNNVIKEVRKLKEKKHRIEKNQFIVEGFRFATEALQSSFEVPMVFVSDSAEGRWDSFNVEALLQKNTKVYWVKENVLKTICSTDTPQGIAAVVNNKNKNLEDKHGIYVLVDRLQDPGNLGTIIRTAHAAGALGVIFTKGTVDAYNEKTLRSTMGSIFNIPVIEDKDLSIIKGLKEKGFKLVVSSLNTDKNFYDANLEEKVIICVGSEATGASEEIYDLSDIKVKIPMPGGAESLNAAVAGAIMIYEAVRQRQ